MLVNVRAEFFFSIVYYSEVKVTFSFMSSSLGSPELWPAQSSVHRILQARVLEWGAIAFSKENLDLPSGRGRGEEFCNQLTHQ